MLEYVPTYALENNQMIPNLGRYTIHGAYGSGKRLHSYGKSPDLIGKPSTNGTCLKAMLVYWRVK
jgi:hypothetical protein